VSRGLGGQQWMILDALSALETKYGSGRWFYVHAVVRTAWPGDAETSQAPSALRPRRDTEAALNPSGILAALARRRLIDRTESVAARSSSPVV
jgi:hypothetical protein